MEPAIDVVDCGCASRAGIRTRDLPSMTSDALPLFTAHFRFSVFTAGRIHSQLVGVPTNGLAGVRGEGAAALAG
eukprot:COSAG01_NODE_287_length_19408_cov_231.791703_19_plen_74_part_00